MRTHKKEQPELARDFLNDIVRPHISYKNNPLELRNKFEQAFYYLVELTMLDQEGRVDRSKEDKK